MRPLRPGLAVAVTMFSACAGGSEGGASTPSPVSAVVTFRVQAELFRVKLTTSAQVEAAKAAKAGGSARIPNGRIAAGTDVNTGWSWHLEDVTFADATIELCDGLPSYVEQQGVEFGGGRFCPWTAVIVSIDTP